MKVQVSKNFETVRVETELTATMIPAKGYYLTDEKGQKATPAFILAVGTPDLTASGLVLDKTSKGADGKLFITFPITKFSETKNVTEVTRFLGQVVPKMEEAEKQLLAIEKAISDAAAKIEIVQ